MTKILFFSLLIFLLTPRALAEIKEGKSTVNTQVTTNVNNSSNNSDNNSETKTHIEIEVNGEKKVLDTNEPGTHTLSVEKDGGKSSATVKIGNGNSSSQEKDSGPENSINGDGEIKGGLDTAEVMSAEQKNVIHKFFAQISRFFENLFNFF